MYRQINWAIDIKIDSITIVIERYVSRLVHAQKMGKLTDKLLSQSNKYLES